MTNFSVFVIMSNKSKPHIWKVIQGVEHKQCSKCKKFKAVTLDNFYFRKLEPHHPYAACKSCTKQDAAIAVKGRRRRRKLDAIAYKGGKCVDCRGIFTACVYDFHHLDPRQKDFEIHDIINKAKKTIMAELDKCVLLCANCHRIRHDAPAST